MAVAAEPRGPLLERVVDLVRASGRGGEARAKFARLLFDRSDETDLEAYSVEGLAALAISAFEFASQRKPRHHRLRAFNPDKLLTTKGSVTVIEILNDDMPFIVDSIMGEILERALEVHFIVHPVFLAQRGEDGKLKAVAPIGANLPRAIKESYVQIHVERLDSEEEIDDLKNALSDILKTVRVVVRDWRPMLDRLNRAIATYTESPPPVPVSDLAESIQFLKWLADDNFTFLGMRAMAFVGGAREGRLEPAPDTGLGILRDANVPVLRRGSEAVHMTPEIRKFFLAPEPLIITKANVRSIVHRRVHMDYVGVKIYSSSGEISGELRIVGLFTSAAYTRSVKSIPFLRHKVDMVMHRAGFPPDSHSGKALLNVLETFPRGELFQMGVGPLYDTAMGILSLELKPRTRVFIRVDEFDRFVSFLVYVPRDRFSTETRIRIGDFLAQTCNGRVSAFYPFFPEGPLVRVHYIIGGIEGATPALDHEAIEEQVARIVRTWHDSLRELLDDRLDEATARRLARRYVGAFPAAYQASVSVERALADIGRLERLSEEQPAAIDFYRDERDAPERLRVTLYHLNGPIPLSRRVPILENLGFAVIDERSYTVHPHGGGEVALHDMLIETVDGAAVDLSGEGLRLEACFLAVWQGRASNDAYNRLVLCAGFDWREAAVFRAYGSFLRQIRAPFGQAYLAETLVRHPEVARDLLALFKTRFELGPTPVAEREARQSEIVQSIETALEAIPSLDEDRIIRHFRNLICTTQRTNVYRDDAGDTVAFKFKSAELDAAPSPRPFAEIFVFSPRVEGVHLRAGPIARGGLRWSDRLQDFRTEVLGLAKAQQVKNAVIVPNGAKGGFVPKLLPVGAGREAVQAEGVAAYRQFVSTLLSLTDNLQEGRVVPPAQVVRHDGDDPYLVVAADKGTATFSDIANEIAQARGFWLSDAFASGGSAGYDHKKMGITARGAWEAVKRHFREMDIDVQTTPFTVIGVGDMSGDVFGNGMLQSKTIRLLAAFDHRDIFIDPDPDPEASFAERLRLFELPRSSWQDYNPELISRGGGVFSRTSKAIKLSAQIKALTGLSQATATPHELIRALLKAPVDLLWFGGIGTYVKASDESDAEVGDRSNDALRVRADEVRARVIGEGANLAVTQRARIEFARQGGRVNTDAIDNSAGVNTSDQEVNIKIALGPLVAAGELDIAARNALLMEMADDVARAVLRNNYLQTLALSMGERRGVVDLAFQARLVADLEASGLLDRALEFLPSDSEFAEREKQGVGLTRPELAVLLAYAKIALKKALIASAVPDEQHCSAVLLGYFPPALRERYPQAIAAHPLRREIIATELANRVVNRGGPTIVARLSEETGRGAAEVALAFTAADAVFDFEDLFADVDSLDNKIAGWMQLDLYLKLQDGARAQTAWFLRNLGRKPLSELIELHRSGRRRIAECLHDVLTEPQRARLAEDRAALENAGLPEEVAEHIAALPYLADAPDMVQVAVQTKRPVEEIALLYNQAITRFRIGELRRAGEKLLLTDYFDRLAINSLNWVLAAALRDIVRDVVKLARQGTPDFAHWCERRKAALARAGDAIDEILEDGEVSLSRLTVAVTHLRDLVGT